MMRSRDIEKLSAYLDGQLSSSDAALLAQRLKSDLELASAFDDMRIARGLIRKLPKRRSPRNFILTRKMVGLNPPLPRTYSLFQYSSAFAAVLLIFTFAFNFVSPRVSYTAALNGGYGGGCSMPCGGGGGFGMGGGGVDAPAAAQELAPPAADQSAPESFATEAPMAAADSAVQSTEESTMKQADDAGDESVPPSAPQQREYFIVAPQWQMIFLFVTLAAGLIAFVIRWNAKRKWN